MTLIPIPGFGPYVPDNMFGLQATPNFGQSVIDATGEKYAWVGRVWNKDHTSKDISRVGFRFGSVTKAGGSALTVSLQDVSLTTAPPQPDEVQDQTVAIANGDAGFTNDIWYRTNTFSANRTVAYGELLAVVIEYDGAGRLGADLANLAGLNNLQTTAFPSAMLKTGGTWATAGTATCNIILEFSDGTFGTLDGGVAMSNLGTQVFKQDTGVADEYGNEFSFPFSCKVDGCWFIISAAAATANFNVILYSGTTPLVTVPIDAHYITTSRTAYIPFAEQTLAANTVYILAIQPTQTTSNVTIYYHDVFTANHFTATGLGPTCRLNSRLDLGAWIGAVTTRRMFAGLRISALDDGAVLSTTLMGAMLT